MAERCDLTDLIKAHCAHCRKIEPPEVEALRVRANLLATGRWFPAQFGGGCATCRGPIHPGTTLVNWTPDGWAGDCCATEAEGG